MTYRTLIMYTLDETTNKKGVGFILYFSFFIMSVSYGMESQIYSAIMFTEYLVLHGTMTYVG